jgi:hypothetical protein
MDRIRLAIGQLRQLTDETLIFVKQPGASRHPDSRSSLDAEWSMANLAHGTRESRRQGYQL